MCVREFNKTTRRKRQVRRQLKELTKLIKQRYAEEHHDMRKISTKEANKIALQQLEKAAVEEQQELARTQFRKDHPVIIQPGESIDMVDF